MGGNTTIKTKNKINIAAERVPLKEIGRDKFVKKFQKFLLQFNKEFFKENKFYIWEDEEEIMNGGIFNGSTSFIMNPTYDSNEILKFKPSIGDLDIAVPKEIGKEIYNFLEKHEGSEFIPGIKYVGNNANNENKLGNTIICICEVSFDNIKINVQMDLELSDMNKGHQTSWSAFSHSSSFEDARAGFKGVAHKFLLRALVGARSQRDDIVIATPSSTPEKVRLEKRQNNLVRLLAFGVDAGVAISFEQMLDVERNPLKIDNKFVYRRLKRHEKNYNKSLDNLFKISFGEYNKKDAEKLWSFVGVIELSKKYLTKKEMEDTANRFFEIFFGIGGQSQAIEPDDPQKDVSIKMEAYEKILREWKIKSRKDIDKDIENYVKRTFK